MSKRSCSALSPRFHSFARVVNQALSSLSAEINSRQHGLAPRPLE